MAPKNIPPVAKQQKILMWFQESMGVYTLKELEKLLPSVGAINGMQVKEYLQALQDENMIRVEKIGSGNWYWSFKSDAKKQKEKVLNNLQEEEAKLKASIADAERQIGEEAAKREGDDEMLDVDGMNRGALLDAHDTLLKEMELFDKELTLYRDSDPQEVSWQIEATRKLEAEARKWTDGIESLESYLVNRLNDRAQVANLMETHCGDEYVTGDGLKEI